MHTFIPSPSCTFGITLSSFHTTQVWQVTFPEQAEYIAATSALKAQTASLRYSPEPSLFFSLFPFHLLLDQDLKIQQVIYPTKMFSLFPPHELIPR